MSITVQEFFPDAKGNLTKIKWSHATNSQAALKKALDSSTYISPEFSNSSHMPDGNKFFALFPRGLAKI